MTLRTCCRISIALLSLAGVGIRAGQSQGRSDTAAASEAFRSGLAAVASHDLAAAEKAFSRVVRLAPAVAAGHSALGAVLVEQGKPAEAVPELRRALQIDPADTSAELNLGIAAAALLDTDPRPAEEGKRALLDWQSRQNSPLPEDATIALARLQLASGEIEAAQKTLHTAVERIPQSAPLQDALGVLLAQQRQFPAAIASFQQALALEHRSPARAGIALHLGSAMLENGDAQGAVPVLHQAVELDPANAVVRIQLGTALFASGREAEGLAVLQDVHRRDPSNTAATYQLALSLESAGKAEEAVPLFQQVRASRPADAALLANLGLALVQTGKAKDAVPIYLEGLKLDANNATLHQDLGVAYLQQSDLDSAIAEFRKGLALQPDSAQIAYDLGLALKLKDNYPEAIAAFEKARSLDPALADAPYTLGVLYMQQGNFAEAARSLRNALQLRPDNGEAWSMLGSVLKQDGKPQDAAEALRKAIELDPGQPGNHVNLASVLVELGQKDEAVKERKTAAELSRAATAKQRERFALDSGNVLKQRGQFAEAITQFRAAVAADPNDPAAHQALADVLAQTGAKAEAEAEGGKAKALASK